MRGQHRAGHLLASCSDVVEARHFGSGLALVIRGVATVLLVTNGGLCGVFLSGPGIGLQDGGQGAGLDRGQAWERFGSDGRSSGSKTPVWTHMFARVHQSLKSTNDSSSLTPSHCAR